MSPDRPAQLYQEEKNCYNTSKVLDTILSYDTRTFRTILPFKRIKSS
jgi:hypothetical protein